RAEKAEEVEQYTEEVRPGQREEIEVHQPAATSQPNSAEASAPQDATAPAAETTETKSAASTEAEPAPEAHASLPGPQVVLKIRRRKFNTQKFGKGEIVVTRRLFRSGESEYLLNGKLCRLRDVHDIFMGTGLGPESYAIIEQGRIGQILSSKPTDRRAIIEEAAGITKFKTRKRLAEARLADAKLNLNRVNDIFDEVTRQMNSLKRQAAKAERYAKLRDEMRAKLRIVLASKFVALDLQLADVDVQLSGLAEVISGKSAALAEKESEHGSRTQRGYAIEEETRQTNERLTSINLEIDRATARRH